MVTITIDPVINGYVIRGYDSKDGYFLNEFQESKLETLKVFNTWLQKEITAECGRLCHAVTL
jgi:hypothetical protein